MKDNYIYVGQRLGYDIVLTSQGVKLIPNDKRVFESTPEHLLLYTLNGKDEVFVHYCAELQEQINLYNEYHDKGTITLLDSDEILKPDKVSIVTSTWVCKDRKYADLY